LIVIDLCSETKKSAAPVARQNPRFTYFLHGGVDNGRDGALRRPRRVQRRHQRSGRLCKIWKSFETLHEPPNHRKVLLQQFPDVDSSRQH
jgi:hypothetical protein